MFTQTIKLWRKPFLQGGEGLWVQRDTRRQPSGTAGKTLTHDLVVTSVGTLRCLIKQFFVLRGFLYSCHTLFKNEEMRKTFNTDQNMALSGSWKAFYVLHNDNQNLVGSGPGLTPRPPFPPCLHLFRSNLLTAPRHTQTTSCSGPLCDQLRLECSCPDLRPQRFLHDSVQAHPLQETLLNHPSLSSTALLLYTCLHSMIPDSTDLLCWLDWSTSCQLQVKAMRAVTLSVMFISLYGQCQAQCFARSGLLINIAEYMNIFFDTGNTYRNLNAKAELESSWMKNIC